MVRDMRKELIRCDPPEMSDAKKGAMFEKLPAKKAIRKTCDASKRKSRTEETRRKKSETSKGKPKSEEPQRKMSESQKNRRRKEKSLIDATIQH